MPKSQSDCRVFQRQSNRAGSQARRRTRILRQNSHLSKEESTIRSEADEKIVFIEDYKHLSILRSVRIDLEIDNLFSTFKAGELDARNIILRYLRGHGLLLHRLYNEIISCSPTDKSEPDIKYVNITPIDI